VLEKCSQCVAMCHSVMQCVAKCSQCVAMCHSVMQCVAKCSQCVAMCHSVLQCVIAGKCLLAECGNLFYIKSDTYTFFPPTSTLLLIREYSRCATVTVTRCMRACVNARTFVCLCIYMCVCTYIYIHIDMHSSSQVLQF